LADGVPANKGESVLRQPCYCDSPLCADLVCRQLGEYRIAHRVITEIRQMFANHPGYEGEMSVDELLGEIEITCDVLVK
jgi:hypothetical protein